MAAPLKRSVSIVVLCWNAWPLTRALLDSLRLHTDLSAVEVIVVDNGSSDETADALRNYSWLRVIRHDTNLGFVRGCNAGIAAAAPDHDVVLLNNDVEVRQPGWLELLARCAYESEDAGIVGCRLVLPDGRLLHAGAYILPDTCWGQQLGSLELDLGQYSDTRRVQSIAFACAYVRREVIAAIGVLSTDYHSYFEDTDYCLRAAERGFATYCCGSVTLVHHEHGSTAADAGWRSRIFQQSRKTFSKRWEDRLAYRSDTRLLIQSILNAPTGYATACREIIRALERRRVRTAYAYLYGAGSPLPREEPEDSGDHLLNLARERGRRGAFDVSIAFGQADAFYRSRGRYRIGYTMLEVDRFPEDWVSQANAMDEVWVPTEFNREGMLRSGVTKPVHVVPLGIDPDHFGPGIRRMANPRGDLVFLSIFEWGERKYPELLLKTFNETFRHEEPVVLICKTINRTQTVSVREQVDRLGLRPEGGRILFMHNRDFPHYQLASLYRSADCYVSAGRGEGWDLPLLEAMACGLPTIATDWGGHTAFADAGNSYPLRIRGVTPALSLCPYYTDALWADPDPHHLAVLLRHVLEHREEAEAVGARAAAVVREQWTWDRTADAITARLETLQG